MRKIIFTILHFLIFLMVVFVYLSFPSSTKAAICNNCTNSNCCDDVCGANYTCTGNKVNGCYCKYVPPPTNTPIPPTSTPVPTCPSNCIGDCSTCGGSYGSCYPIAGSCVTDCYCGGWGYCPGGCVPTETPNPPPNPTRTPTPKKTPTPTPKKTPTPTPTRTPTPKPTKSPTPTPKPGTPTPTPVQNCESCSSLAGKENCDVKWYDPDGKCDSDFYNNMTEDCSATSTCSSAVRNCNRCSSLAGKEHCRVYWTDTTSGNCTANFYNNRQMNCQANSGCPVGGTPTPTQTPTPTGTITPTATPIPGCLCSSSGTCATVCAFDKFSDITYISPVKCSLSPLLFATVPSAANKNSWCQATKRTKGDADGNGVVDDNDYYLYVGATNGGQIPATANPDFNGDGEVGAGDRVIIMKILHP